MSYDERLSRLIRKLSAEHNFQSANDEAPYMRFSSIPLHWGPEICTFPSLSIVPPLYHDHDHHCHQFLQSYEQLDPATKPDQSQHEDYIYLMSRKEKCSQYSIPLASLNMLRSLVLTFKSMLEYQIQHLIFNVMESKRRSILNRQDQEQQNPQQKQQNQPLSKKSDEDQKILDKFANLSTSLSSLSSLVCPESARTNFSTMLPLEQWQEVGYQNISLRLVFRAEIDVRIMPNDTIHKSTLKSTGATIGVFSNHKNRRPEELDIDLNTKALYNTIRRECKIISKKVVNAIVGYELLKQKPKHSSTNSMLMHVQRHPALMSGHHKHMSMHSDGATMKTEKTTLSSVDGRDPRPTSMSIEECSNRSDPSVLHHEGGYNDLTPKKKTNSSKYEYHQGNQHSQNSPALSSGVKSTDMQEVDKKLSNFAIIYEQESLDEAEIKKSKKKKEHGWKRLLSPHKGHKNESLPNNQGIPKEIDSHCDLADNKVPKKHEGRWKGLRFASSKQ